MNGTDKGRRDAGDVTVSLRRCRKTYPGGIEAIKGIDLDIYEGEFVVLVGPSGCGKSTLLRMIAGLESITEGELMIAGRFSNDLHPKDRNIAMVFQDYALYPHMTVYENMAFGLRQRSRKTGLEGFRDAMLELFTLGYHKCVNPTLDNTVHNAAQILGIEDLLARKPGELSGGQRQRVAMGRAIVRDPVVFLFDEPLSNLDAKLREGMRVELSRLHQKLKATVIYVTHDQTEAMTLGQRIVVMDDGIVKQIDTPANVYSNPADRFVARFIGSPTMNMFRGRVIRHKGCMMFCSGEGPDDLRLPLDISDEYEGPWEVELGIRPEHIQVMSSESVPETPGVVGARVQVIEHFGSYILLVVQSGTAEYVAKASAERNTEVGDVLQVSFDLRKMHLFDLQGTVIRK